MNATLQICYGDESYFPDSRSYGSVRPCRRNSGTKWECSRATSRAGSTKHPVADEVYIEGLRHTRIKADI